MADYKWFSKVHKFVYEKSGGLIGTKMAGQTMGLLTTIGRKSGEKRTTPLAYYSLDLEGALNPAGVIVLGSNNGNPKPPLWWTNLQANPNVEIQIGRRKHKAIAEEIIDARREQFWEQMVKRNPLIAPYPARSGRRLPIVLLRFI